MAKGGKTNEQMKKLGRNLAKVANQKREVRKFLHSRANSRRQLRDGAALFLLSAVDH